MATTLPAGLAFAELLHALPKLGAALVPLNTRLSAAERQWQIRDAAPRVVVEEPVEGPEATLIPRTDLPAGEPHSVIYTSGTSARPKPVILTHANHTASALASAWNLGVDPDDRWLCPLPVFHVGGLAILLRSAVYGTAAILHPSFEEDDVAASLRSGEATLVSLVPTMLRRLASREPLEAPGLRAMLLGGAPVPRDLIEWGARQGLPLVQTYGMTETASQIAALPVEEARADPVSAGRPLPTVGVRIASDGEVLVHGPMVSPRAVGPDGWLRTGDRGRLDEEGLLWIDGRLKDVIVTGGENVGAAEVEEVLLSHPSVEDAAVVGRPDPEWGEAVTAFVVLSSPTASAQLIAHCRERLAAFKVPKGVVAVEELPRNAAGKLMRGELRA